MRLLRLRPSVALLLLLAAWPAALPAQGPVFPGERIRVWPRNPRLIQPDLRLLTPASRAQEGIVLSASEGQVVMEIDRLLAGATTGKILREGLKTVIIGKPNVGKSSMLNALSRTNRAIVTDIPGTTRDILEEQINLRGIPLNIIDTAGIRETEDVVEKLGVERSRSALEQADLVLFMIDASRPLNEVDRELLVAVAPYPAIVILNKLDLPRQADLGELKRLAQGKTVVETSVATGAGLEELERAVEDLFLSGGIEGKESTYISNARHVGLLEKAKREMQEALDTAEMGMTLDLVAVDIRNAWMSLGEVTGEAVADDLLDQIFSQFCLGK